MTGANDATGDADDARRETGGATPDRESDATDAVDDAPEGTDETAEGGQTPATGETPRDAADAADDPSDTDEAIARLLRPRSDPDAGAVPDDLRDLKFVGPATSDALESSEIDVEAIVDGTVSYRDLVAAGVNPGVAAKIRRWHSLSWSFGSGDDLDRRSAQVRGLGDEERAWVAASSGAWSDEADDDAESESGDWTPTGASSQARSSPPPASRTDGDWTPRGGEASDESPVRDGDWTPSGTSGDDAPARDGSTPTRQGDWSPGRRASTSTDGSGDAIAAEAAWRERSSPTPVTSLDGIDDDDAEMLAEAGVRSVRRLATADPEHVADALLIDVATVSEWKRAARDAMD